MPDINDLKTLYEQYAETYYKECYSRMQKAKKYYDGDFETVRPPDVEPIKPPIAKTRMDRAVQELITDQPKVRRRRGSDDGPNKQKNDDAIEKALQGFLLDAEEYQQTPLLFEASKLQILRGAAVLAGPFYDATNNRCYFDVYDPLTVYVEPGPFPRNAFLHVKLTVMEMEQLAAKLPRFKNFSRRERKVTDEIELIQWWGNDEQDDTLRSGQFAAWIKDDAEWVCPPTPSGYPYLIMDMIPSGWGERHIGSKPEDIYVSLLHPGVQTILQAQAEAFIMRHASIREATWNRYKLPEGQELPSDFKIETLPNSITRNWPPGLEPMEYNGIPAEAASHVDYIDDVLDEALYPKLLLGERQPGVSTATAYSLLMGKSRRRFDPPMRHLQAGVSRLLLKVGLLLKFRSEMPGNGETKFTWRGCDLEPKMYGDDFTVEVDLSAEDEEERRIKVAEGVTLWDKVDHRHIGENYFDMENWSEHEEQKIFEDLIHSEQFMATVLEIFTGIVQRRQAEKQAEGEQEGAGGLERLASAYRQAKGGFAPTQVGTLENVAARMREGMPVGGRY